MSQLAGHEITLCEHFLRRSSRGFYILQHPTSYHTPTRTRASCTHSNMSFQPHTWYAAFNRHHFHFHATVNRRTGGPIGPSYPDTLVSINISRSPAYPFCLRVGDTHESQELLCLIAVHVPFVVQGPFRRRLGLSRTSRSFGSATTSSQVDYRFRDFSRVGLASFMSKTCQAANYRAGL